MKEVIFSIVLIGASFLANTQNELNTNPIDTANASFTIGLLNGGGSLIGVDFEFSASKRISYQFGIGAIGAGAGLNYHLKPTLRSSFISLQYWNQGVVPEFFVQSLVGPNYVFRSKKGFTFQLGMGYRLRNSPRLDSQYTKTPVLLMFSIGGYKAYTITGE